MEADGKPHEIAPGIVITLTPGNGRTVPCADLAALVRTQGELVALLDALDAAPLAIRAARGLARSVAARLAKITTQGE
jgi:hypothetical protein